MTAIEVEGTDGALHRLVVRQPGETALRQSPRATENEFKILLAAHAAGLAVPRVYFYDQGGEFFSSPYLVCEYIDGAPHFDRSPPDNYFVQLADHLVKIHRLDWRGAGLNFLPPQRLEHPGLTTEGALIFDVTAVRAALLSGWPPPLLNPPALLHGDYWPGNILWKNGRLAAVIDWEDAHWGDPLADLSITRLDLLWIYGQKAMEIFTHRYLSRGRVNTRSLPYWDIIAALRLVRLVGNDLSGWAAFFAPYNRSDITGASIQADFSDFVDRALAKLSKST
jgi:aminoglycoside phosphotransferase (APT) family kinase protein